MEEEAINEYRSSLMDLNFNSKPLINMLTMLADDNEQHAPHIVEVIESHITKVDAQKKLPAMYLIDSIIKNLPKSTYLSLFSHNIVSTFCGMFEKVDEKARQSMFKVRQTWNDLFPNRRLYAIDVRVNLVDPAWPITAQAPVEGSSSIHVNPKFLANKKEEEEDDPADSPLLMDTEEQEAVMRQQLIAKQQELLKLQQQRLELELKETKAKLEQQKQVNSSDPAVSLPDLSASTLLGNLPPETSSQQTVSVSAPVTTTASRPITRDPRLASRDPRRRPAPAAAQEETAPVSTTVVELAVSQPPFTSQPPVLGPPVMPPGMPPPAMMVPPHMPPPHMSMPPQMFNGPPPGGMMMIPPLRQSMVSGPPPMSMIAPPSTTASVMGPQPFYPGGMLPFPMPTTHHQTQSAVDQNNQALPSTANETSESVKLRKEQKPSNKPEKAKDSCKTKPDVKSNGNDPRRHNDSKRDYKDKKDYKSSSPSLSSSSSSSGRKSSPRHGREESSRSRRSEEDDKRKKRSSHDSDDESRSKPKSDSDKKRDAKPRSSKSQKSDSKSTNVKRSSRDKSPTRRSKSPIRRSRSPLKSRSPESKTRNGKNKDKIKSVNTVEKSKAKTTTKDVPKENVKQEVKEKLVGVKKEPVTEAEDQSKIAAKKDIKLMKIPKIKKEPVDPESSVMEVEIQEKPVKQDTLKRELNIEEPEPEVSSTSKKPRLEETSETKESSSAMDDDLSSLFGTEDTDYRSATQKSPHHARWAKFRTDHAEEFQYEIDHEKVREQEAESRQQEEPQDIDLRASFSSSKDEEQDSDLRKSGITQVQIPNVLSLDHREEIIQQIQKRRQSGELTFVQQQELLLQLAKLDHVQKQQERLRQQDIKSACADVVSQDKMETDSPKKKTQDDRFNRDSPLKDLHATSKLDYNARQDLPAKEQERGQGNIAEPLQDFDGREDPSRREFDARRNLDRGDFDGRSSAERDYDNRRDFVERKSNSPPRDFDNRKASKRDYDNRKDFDKRGSPPRDFDRRRENSRNYDGRRGSPQKDFDGRRISPSRDFDGRRGRSARDYDGRRVSPSRDFDGRRVSPSRDFDGRRDGPRQDFDRRRNNDYSERPGDWQDNRNRRDPGFNRNNERNVPGPRDNWRNEHRPRDGPPHSMDGPRPFDDPSQGPSIHMDGPPRHMDGPPRHMDGPPRHMDGPQRHMDGPPRHMDGPPRHMDGPPRHMDGPPRHMDGPPRHMDGPPRHMDGPPRHMDGPPRHMDGPPRHMDGPPRPMDNGPRRRDGPPGRFDHNGPFPGRNFPQKEIPSLLDGPDMNRNVGLKDPRWRCSKGLGMFRPEESEEFVIDGKPYCIQLGQPARNIRFSGEQIEVFADPNERAIRMNGKIVYRFGDLVKDVEIGRGHHKIFYHGLPRLLWIDTVLRELRIDAPPKIVLIKDQEHTVRIDGRDNMILIDNKEFGQYGGPPRFVFIDNNRTELRFDPPPRKILIDKQMCELKLDRAIPCVMVDGKPRGIRFDGPPREIIVNDIPYLVPMDEPIKFKISNRPHFLAFGGPAHEVILDGKWFEVKFGGPKKEICLNNRVINVQLDGPPPDVKIQDEIIEENMLPPPPHPGLQPMPNQGPRPQGQFGPPMMQRHPGPDGPRPMGQMPMGPPQQMMPQGPMQLGGPNMMGPQHQMPGMMGPQMMPADNMQHQFPGMMPQQNPMMAGGVPQGGMMPQQQAPGMPLPNMQLDINSLLQRLKATGILKSEEKQQAPQDTKEKPVEEAGKPPSFEKPVFKPVKLKNIPDLTSLKTEVLKKPHEGVIQRLYSGIQCSSCGQRFTAQQTDTYREHLDWHFRQNRRDKDDSKVTKFRRWFYSYGDWLEYEEIDESADKGRSAVFDQMLTSSSAQNTNASAKVELTFTMPEGTNITNKPAATGDENGDICEICKDPFEQFWDEEAEEWHLRDAIRVDNKTYHPVCYEDEKEGSILEPTPTPVKAPIVNPLILQIQEELGGLASSHIHIDPSSVKEITEATRLNIPDDDEQGRDTPTNDEIEPKVTNSENVQTLPNIDIVKTEPSAPGS